MKRKIFTLGMILDLILLIILLINKLYLYCLVALMLFIISFLFFLKKIVFIPSRVKVNYLKRIKRTKKKKVSVVIPNYNYANYIENRINSIVNQTYPIYELIILDDYSTDNSDEIISNKIELLKNNYPNMIIKYIKNKKNSGNVFKQWEKAFEESTGDYLWIAEADDLCNKNFLNVAMQGFEDDDVVLSYTESKGIDGNKNVLFKDFRIWTDPFKKYIWNYNFIMDGHEFLNQSLCINNSITNASGVVFKKIDSIDYLKYLKGAQKFKLSGDWYFYVNYLCNGKISYSSDSLNYHRVHENSVTNKTDSKLKIDEVVNIQKYVKSISNISKDNIGYANKFVEDLKRDLNK